MDEIGAKKKIPNIIFSSIFCLFFWETAAVSWQRAESCIFHDWVYSTYSRRDPINPQPPFQQAANSPVKGRSEALAAARSIWRLAVFEYERKPEMQTWLSGWELQKKKSYQHKKNHLILHLTASRRKQPGLKPLDHSFSQKAHLWENRISPFQTHVLPRATSTKTSTRGQRSKVYDNTRHGDGGGGLSNVVLLKNRCRCQFRISCQLP